MKAFIFGELLKPIAARLGTAIGGVLVGMGVEAHTTEQISLGLTAAVLVLGDLIVRKVLK